MSPKGKCGTLYRKSEVCSSVCRTELARKIWQMAREGLMRASESIIAAAYHFAHCRLLAKVRTRKSRSFHFRPAAVSPIMTEEVTLPMSLSRPSPS